MDLFYYFFLALIWIVVLLKQIADGKKYLNNK